MSSLVAPPLQRHTLNPNDAWHRLEPYEFRLKFAFPFSTPLKDLGTPEGGENDLFRLCNI